MDIEKFKVLYGHELFKKLKETNEEGEELVVIKRGPSIRQLTKCLRDKECYVNFSLEIFKFSEDNPKKILKRTLRERISVFKLERTYEDDELVFEGRRKEDRCTGLSGRYSAVARTGIVTEARILYGC